MIINLINYLDKQDSHEHHTMTALYAKLVITSAFRSIHSPKAKTPTLQAEYIGLIKFIPKPATEEMMQIWPRRRRRIGSIIGRTVFLQDEMLASIRKSYNYRFV